MIFYIIGGLAAISALCFSVLLIETRTLGFIIMFGLAIYFIDVRVLFDWIHIVFTVIMPWIIFIGFMIFCCYAVIKINEERKEAGEETLGFRQLLPWVAVPVGGFVLLMGAGIGAISAGII